MLPAVRRAVASDKSGLTFDEVVAATDFDGNRVKYMLDKHINARDSKKAVFVLVGDKYKIAPKS